ncbi:MAG: ribonuclease E inhibitor RraB [Planctomycetota bacterium]
MRLTCSVVLAAATAMALAACDGAKTRELPRGLPVIEVTGIRDNSVVGTFANTTNTKLIFAPLDDVDVDYLELEEALDPGMMTDAPPRWVVVEPGETVPFEARGWCDGLAFRVRAHFRYDDESSLGSVTVASRRFEAGELEYVSTDGTPPRRAHCGAEAYSTSKVLNELAGESVRWSEWEDGVEVRKSFECGRASVGRQLLSIDFTLLEPDEEGFATADDGFAIDRIGWYMHNHLDGEPIGSIARPGVVSLSYAAFDATEVMDERSGLRTNWTEHDLRVELVEDPEHRFYREELLPPAYARLLLASESERAVPLADLLGDQRDEPRDVIHGFFFDDEEAARAFALELGVAELARSQLSKVQGRVWLELTLEGKLDDASLEARTRDFGVRAARLGGDYVRWTAPVVPLHPSPVVFVDGESEESR